MDRNVPSTLCSIAAADYSFRVHEVVRAPWRSDLLLGISGGRQARQERERTQQRDRAAYCLRRRHARVRPCRGYPGTENTLHVAQLLFCRSALWHFLRGRTPRDQSKPGFRVAW